MGIFAIPERCRRNPLFNDFYASFCDDVTLADALRMDEEVWSDEFEKYIERMKGRGKQ